MYRQNRIMNKQEAESFIDRKWAELTEQEQEYLLEEVGYTVYTADGGNEEKDGVIIDFYNSPLSVVGCRVDDADIENEVDRYKPYDYASIYCSAGSLDEWYEEV